MCNTYVEMKKVYFPCKWKNTPVNTQGRDVTELNSSTFQHKFRRNFHPIPKSSDATQKQVGITKQPQLPDIDEMPVSTSLSTDVVLTLELTQLLN